jgi:hypothetical protein
MSERKALSKKDRFEVFKRDAFTCVYCGAHPPKVILHCDHVIAVVAGGTNDIDNLVTACDACNLGKGGRPLTAVPLGVEEKAALLEEREAQIVAFNELVTAKRQRIEDTAWIVAEKLMFAWGDDDFRKDWFASIERFVERLSLDDLLEAADIAITRFGHRSRKPCFAYFCGVCWNKIRGPQ